jgi:predicted TIM-barrel fold metal-dependent hydrolase
MIPAGPSALRDLPLVDHHCHAVTTMDLDRDRFERFLTESHDRPPAGTTAFDTPLGLALLRWCPPVLGLPPFPSPELYVERRTDLGPDEANGRFLRAAALSDLLVDTGFLPEAATTVPEMAGLAGAPVFEVVRLETIAEEVAASGAEAGRFPQAFGEALERAANSAVALKSVVAYRGGFGFDPAAPTENEVVRAADRWLSQGPPYRITDPILLRHCLWVGAELGAQRGLPLQIHAGYGDPDLTLHLANPVLLTAWIRHVAGLGTTLTLLHCYPYHREAAYLAAMFPHVYLDVGLAINAAGPGAQHVLAEAMEVAPFPKLLYASDGFGLSELHFLGAALFRRGLEGVLGGWIEGDHCTAEHANRIARLIGGDNSRRIYRLRVDRTAAG